MRVHRMRFVLPAPLLLACFVTIASPDFVFAQTLDSLMDGFRSERELFRSGRYRMTGTFNREDATTDCRMSKPQAFSGFVAVDHDARLFRVDSVWPVCTDLNGQVDFIQMSKRCAFTVTKSMGTGQPAGTPDRRMINVWQAGKLGGSSNPVYSDVRMCGATNLVGLRRRLPTFPNSSFERFSNSPSIYPEVKISKAPGGLTRIELFKKGKIDLRRKIWINESRGFTIERSEFSYCLRWIACSSLALPGKRSMVPGCLSVFRQTKPLIRTNTLRRRLFGSLSTRPSIHCFLQWQVSVRRPKRRSLMCDRGSLS